MSRDPEPETPMRGGAATPTRWRFLAMVALVCLVGLTLTGFGPGGGTAGQVAGLSRLGERDWAAEPLRTRGRSDGQVWRGYVSQIGSPLLHLPPSPDFPRGRVMLLAGEGARDAGLPWAAGPVELRGSLVRHGGLEVLVVDAPARRLDAAPELSPAAREPLGRRRLVGQICDGTCRPGVQPPDAVPFRRVCATICLIGNVPAVLVTVEPVAGSHVLVLAGRDGGPFDESIRGWLATPAELQGEVERVGNILVLRLDAGQLRRL